MIKECNFKHKLSDNRIWCRIAPDNITNTFSTIPSECSGEDNCILFQIYKRGLVEDR